MSVSIYNLRNLREFQVALIGVEEAGDSYNIDQQPLFLAFCGIHLEAEVDNW
jgi:hypothetical protein